MKNILNRVRTENKTGSGIVAFEDKSRVAPYPIKPLGGPFRRWHLTPWKSTEATAILDGEGNLGAGYDPDEDNYGDYSNSSSPSAGGWDFLNNLVTQAGNVWGRGTIVPRGQPGRLPRSRPSGSVAAGGGFLGFSTQTLLLVGAGLAGIYFLAKKK